MTRYATLFFALAVSAGLLPAAEGPAFTAYARITSIGPDSQEWILRENSVTGIRANGSSAVWRARFVTGSERVIGEVTDATSRTSVFVDRSEGTTMRTAFRQLLSPAETAVCDPNAASRVPGRVTRDGGLKLLGYSVIQHVLEIRDPKIGEIRMEVFRAPALGCFALKNVATRLSPSGRSETIETEVYKVIEGEPDSSLFDQVNKVRSTVQ